MHLCLINFIEEVARAPGLEPGIIDPKSIALPAWPRPIIDLLTEL